MATYSVSILGVGAQNPFQPKFVKVDDAVSNSPQQEQQAMRLGTPFLAQGSDGSSFWAVYDDSRCIPGVQRIIRRYY